MSARKVMTLAIVTGSLSLFVPARECRASSKEECVDAHSRGQDLREKGLLTRARRVFLTCAQTSCPGLIQGDCARFGDELERMVPTVTFGARDARATDLPNTTVYVDDVLVATRLDDGKAYELDPGKHTLRFVHEGSETTLRAVLGQGEKGRVLIATFADREVPPIDLAAHDLAPEPRRPMFPLVVAGLGAAALATGGALLALGLHKVPDACSVSTKECAASPGDPSFDGARSGVSLANIGAGVGIGGAALLVGGIVWYAVEPKTPIDTRRGRLVQPWVGRGSGGLSVVSSF